jgi:hypothetical protein
MDPCSQWIALKLSAALHVGSTPFCALFVFCQHLVAKLFCRKQHIFDDSFGMHAAGASLPKASAKQSIGCIRAGIYPVC